MAQYHKLFDKSEIEYITPFLKLWMSFNNWYKKDLASIKIKIRDKDGNIKKNHDGSDREKEISKDFEAIEYYCFNGKIKEEFLRFFTLSSDIGIDFQNALYYLILNLKNYDLKKEKSDGTSESVGYLVTDRDGVKYSYIYENIDKRGGKDPIYISTDKKRFQILEEARDLFFIDTLEIIYQVRCNLVHGNFDIENQYFLKLVESSYKVLYPIINKILQEENE